MNLKRRINKVLGKKENNKHAPPTIRLEIREGVWAHIFHDTIKDRVWLRELSISPGRWAGNYSFFYLLVRILSDYKPKRILEFGLGESTKVISAFLRNDLSDSKHDVLEHDVSWIHGFSNRYSLNHQTKINHFPLADVDVKGFPVCSYKDMEQQITELYDFYVVDGPLGSDNYSRYQIFNLLNNANEDSQFVVLFDDYNRDGEQETIEDVKEMLTHKNIKFYTGIYHGVKSQIVIATEQYRFATSL
jgi:hypothetical protein